MKRTEDKIRKAFENATPNVLNTVLSECCEEKGTVIPMTEKKRNRFKFKEFAATAAAVVLLFGVGYFAAGMIGSQGQLSQSASSGGQIDATTDTKAELIGQAKAKHIALKDIFKDDLEKLSVPPFVLSTYSDAEGAPYYNVKVSYSNLVNNYKIDAVTGKIADTSTQKNLNAELIPWQTARDNALNHTKIVELKYLSEFEIEFGTKYNTHVYEISFAGSPYSNEYEYIVDAYTGNSIKHSIEPKDRSDYPESALGNVRSRHLCVDFALEHAGISRDDLIDLDTGFKNNRYDIVFKTESGSYTYQVDAATGEILSPATNKPAPDGKITANMAIDLAVEYFNLERKNVMYEGCELDSDDDFPHYDVTFYCDDYVYSCEVGIYSTEIRDPEKEPMKYGDESSGQIMPLITANEALELAAKHFKLDISKLKHTECETDHDDDHHDSENLHYDVSFEFEGYDYECEVDAFDGTIRNAEKERDD